MSRFRRHSLTLFSVLLNISIATYVLAATSPPPADRPEPSAMGALFMGRSPLPAWLDSVDRPTPSRDWTRLPQLLLPKGPSSGDLNVTPGASRFQSETTIAAAGDQVVIGFNDATGFSNPDGISVSGFSYSNDGGMTFTYGGQLPVLGTGDAVRGDPDVKAWIDPQDSEVTFVYSSLYRDELGEFSLCVHVSTDGGMTWEGPREVTTITSPTDFADKEFLDVDPETGRLLLSWTSFGADLEMRTTYSDDFGLTWATYTVFAARAEDGQGSCPRFDPSSDNAYIVWRSFGSPAAISVVRSEDNGVTWNTPSDIVTGVVTPRSPYGSDRINGYPALAVSPVTGDLHVIYASRETSDFGDVYHISSSNAGTTWTSPTALNGNPGSDRAQFFSWISVNDAAPERIDAIWYSQRAGTGASDLTELVHAHSSDGGVNWTAPVALTRQPFHAEYGQDSGQPNIGDYNQCVSIGSFLYTSFARTDVADYLTSAPDTYFSRNDGTLAAAAVRLETIDISDLGCETDGLLVAGEIADLMITLRSDDPMTLSGISGQLSTTTSGISILTAGSVSFADIAGLGAGSSVEPFRIRVDDAFPCGQAIDFLLEGSASGGAWSFPFSLPTGVAVGATTLLSENFDGIGSGLPAGWAWTQGEGDDNPWQVSSDFSVSGNNSLFCDNFNARNLSVVESPEVIVPAEADLVEVSFKVTYEIEEVGDGRMGYDGCLLKIRADGTDVLAGAFSTLFEGQYRTQLVRGSGDNANPLQDLSAWSGNALPDFETIRIQYPGLAGRAIQLLYLMGSDGNTGGTGMYIDDVQVRAIPVDCGPCSAAPQLALDPTELVFPAVPGGETTCLPIEISNPGDGFLDIVSVSGCDDAPFALDLTGLGAEILPLGSASFEVCLTPTQQGPDTCTVTIETNAGTEEVLVIYDIVTAVGNDLAVPRFLTVEPAVPNPFNPRVQVKYALPTNGPVTAAVYDLSGRKVRDIFVAAPRTAGGHTLTWDGTDQHGGAVSSGVYLFQIRTEQESRSVRATLLR